MAIVSLQKCSTYDNSEVKAAVRTTLKNIGFNPASLKNRRVCLKPNLLMPFGPERALTTHPEVFRAVAEIVKEHTDNVVVIESPNFFPLVSTMKKTGLYTVARDLGIEIADNMAEAVIRNEEGKRFKQFEISKAFFDVDAIISIPKLKTHGFTHYTGAVKNLFGTMPGTRKSRMHMRAPSQVEFSEFLLDLYGALLSGFGKKMRILHVMDAVIGMEGEGPGPSGKPRHIGAVLASEDAVALDYVAVSLVGLNEKKVLTLREGFSRGCGAAGPDDISVTGEELSRMRIHDFVPSKVTMMGGVFWPMTSPTVKNLFVEKPVPQAGTCTLCYNCMKVCPAGAIREADGGRVPRYNHRKCIRCYCCMETCPEAAISLQKGRLQWMLKI
jgi:uncharacterized protein (DUF362 family)/Pyruvate/2-oxoacid:ferredoxin oxidoreductase delta subunit